MTSFDHPPPTILHERVCLKPSLSGLKDNQATYIIGKRREN
jgi:hypothetical protein